MLNLRNTISNSEELEKVLEKAKNKRYKLQRKNAEYVKMAKIKRQEEIKEEYPKEKMERCKKVFPILCNLMKLRTLLSGVKVIQFNKYQKDNSDRPIIYVPTHIGKFDIEVAYECIGKHALLLSGTEERMHGSMDGYFLEKNGVNYVDRSDALDRKLSVQKMILDLKNGVDILWFIEGTWNLEENQLIYDVSHSVIKVALETGAKIVPIGFNQVDKNIFVNFGEAYQPTSDNLVEEIIKLRDILATLKWDLYEYAEMWQQTKITPAEYKKLDEKEYYCTKRSDIPDDYWAKYLIERVEEWPITDLEEEWQYVYKPKDDAHKFFEEFNSRVTTEKGKQKVYRI